MLSAAVARRSVVSSVRAVAQHAARHNSSIAAAATTTPEVGNPIATPLLVDLPTRWEKLPTDEQVDLSLKIWARQQGPWTDLSLEEKRASFYISYGPWGPRKPLQEPYDNYRIFAGTVLGIAAAFGIFAIARQFGGANNFEAQKRYEAAREAEWKEIQDNKAQ
ncbi:cytochrome c oxidase subunit IV-domain-containing protein [Lipomyces japonicus]|uniref:cytochrome c oxidase subunit IV-domain-containing protein n=1 Tax=Lipomyces japonicus TaxID=56871 RepID=UPI0034CED7F4